MILQGASVNTPRMAARPSPIYLLAGGLSWPLVRLLFRLRATGLEDLPKTGGYVLAANHTSNFDPWALGIPLFPRRWLRFMAKSELYWQPLFPEGTRVRKGLRKRWEARPHTGAARIAWQAGAPLVPAAIKGTDRLARLGPLHVAYGPPVEVSEDSRETTERLMAEIRRLHEAP